MLDRVRLATLAITLVCFATAGCASAPATDAPDREAPASEAPASEAPTHEAPTPEAPPGATGPVAPGETTRAAVLAHHADWQDALSAASADAQAAEALAQVEPGATVVVYLGAWCSDSRREVTRFWKALDAAGQVAFEVRYIALDRDFVAGDVPLSDADLRAVPTFVVLRDGREVGRVVETAVEGIEHDVLDLLTGQRAGVISSSL